MTTTPVTATGRDRTRHDSVSKAISKLCEKAETVPSDYDSVVIIGDEGLTTGAFAARLARDPKFAGKVTIVGSRVDQDPQLRNGVSLRGTAADYLTYALDVDLATFVETVTPGWYPASTQQTVCIAAPGTNGYEFSRVGPWQNHSGKGERPITFGFRNAATAAAISSLSADLIRVEGQPTDVAAARQFANGERPLIVDVTKPGLLAGRRKPSGWGIAAVQAPFTRPLGLDSEARGPLGDNNALAPLVRREGRVDVGYFTPFADILSPEANFYGILARAVQFEKERSRKDHELAALRSEMLGIAEGCGLTPVNLEQTFGEAWVPAPVWKAGEATSNGVFDLRRSCTPGIAAYYADGMTGAAIAGVSAAEAILNSKDPLAVANAALRRFRRWNQIWWFETVKIPFVVDKLVRLSPQVALSWPHSTAMNSWASAA